MQSSGVGNCINMLSLAARLPLSLLVIITMRGEWGGGQSMAGADGSDLGRCKSARGGRLRRASSGRSCRHRRAAARNAFGDERIAAVILSQRLIGKKVWTK